MSFRLACVLVLIPLLSACGRPGPAPPPGRAALAPKGALNAAGEPQWTAFLRAGTLRFTTANGVDVTVRAAVEDHGRSGAVWSGAPPPPPGAAEPAEKSEAVLRLSVMAKPCQDAATGLAYPLTAVVDLGGKHYGGCAALPGQGLGPRT